MSYVCSEMMMLLTKLEEGKKRDTLENFMKRDKLNSVDQDSPLKSNLKGNEKFGILFQSTPSSKI